MPITYYLNCTHLIGSYWGIENRLHYRRDVPLREDRTRMTNQNLVHTLACLNNLVLKISLWKCKFQFLPYARRYFGSTEAFSLIRQF